MPIMSESYKSSAARIQNGWSSDSVTGLLIYRLPSDKPNLRTIQEANPKFLKFCYK